MCAQYALGVHSMHVWLCSRLFTPKCALIYGKLYKCALHLQKGAHFGLNVHYFVKVCTKNIYMCTLTQKRYKCACICAHSDQNDTSVHRIYFQKILSMFNPCLPEAKAKTLYSARYSG